MPPIIKTCSKCGQDKPSTDFYRHKATKQLYGDCKNCHQVITGNRTINEYDKSPRHRLLISSKNGARFRKLVHTLTVEDIRTPKYCPILGIRLDYSRSKLGRGKVKSNAATIDRIDSSKGYTKENTHTISWIANRLKGNFTKEELLRFARGILRMYGEE